MFKSSGFHFTKSMKLSIFFVVMGMMLFAIDASAQTENEKVVDTYPKSNDRVILEDNTLIHDQSANKSTASKPSNLAKTSVTPPSKTDPIVAENVSDAKKNDSPSTLSFNIFLYIVDKFKAD